MAHVQMLCHLLDVLFVPENTPAECPKDWHDIFFVFACVWAFGSAMFQDTSIDYRVGKFSSHYGTIFTVCSDQRVGCTLIQAKQPSLRQRPFCDSTKLFSFIFYVSLL